MSILQMFYFTLFALVTFFHNLYITLCEVVDRLKPALTQAILAVEIGTGYGDTLLLRSTGREFINQDKLLPRHIACVFVGEGVQSVNIDKIVTIVRWCGAAGIRSISLYDHTGIIRESREAVQHKLKSVEPYREDGSTEEIYSVHQGFITRDTYVERRTVSLCLHKLRKWLPLKTIINLLIKKWLKKLCRDITLTNPN